MTTFKFIVALVVILLIADFGVRNNEVVPINYRFGMEGELPLFVVMLVSIFIGFVIAYTAEHMSSFRARRETKRLRRRIGELDEELAEYREKELMESEMVPDTESDVATGMGPEMKPEMGPGMRSEIVPDTEPEMEPEVELEIEHEVLEAEDGSLRFHGEEEDEESRG